MRSIMPFDITAQIETWRKQLLDTTKRNRLVSFKVGRAGGIALAQPDPGDLWDRLIARNDALTFVWKRDLVELPADEEEAPDGSVSTLFDPSEVPEKDTSQNILERCRCSPRLRPDHLLTDLSD